MNKSILKSKTVWVNLVVLPLLPALKQMFPVLEPILTEQVVASVVMVVNIFLRIITKGGVEVLPKK